MNNKKNVEKKKKFKDKFNSFNENLSKAFDASVESAFKEFGSALGVVTFLFLSNLIFNKKEKNNNTDNTSKEENT